MELSDLPGTAGWLTIVLCGLLFALLIGGLHLMFYASEAQARQDVQASIIAGEWPPWTKVLWLPIRYAIGGTSHGIVYSIGLLALEAYDRLTPASTGLLYWNIWFLGGLVIGGAHILRARGDWRQTVGWRRHDIVKDLDDTPDEPPGRTTRRATR
jgi:hypothetical protein